MGGVFVVIPYLLHNIRDRVLMGVLIVLLIAFIKAVNDHLLREENEQTSLILFLQAYGIAVLALIFELALLALAVPVILIHLLTVLSGMAIFVFLIGLIICILQLYLGLQIGRPLTPQDLQDTALWLGYAVATALVCVGVIRIAGKYKDRFFEHIANFFHWWASR